MRIIDVIIILDKADYYKHRAGVNHVGAVFSRSVRFEALYIFRAGFVYGIEAVGNGLICSFVQR